MINDRITHTREYKAHWIGKSEFYSGVGLGDEVTVREETVAYTGKDQYDQPCRKATVILSVNSGGPWLVVHNLNQLEEI